MNYVFTYSCLSENTGKVFDGILLDTVMRNQVKLDQSQNTKRKSGSLRYGNANERALWSLSLVIREIAELEIDYTNNSFPENADIVDAP